jgi:hypothetical protein
MTRQLPRIGVLVVLVTATVLLAGCVERRVKITTEPPGALVLVNDEEVGISPVSFSFVWYGDYDLMFRKPGYKTLKTHARVNAPWYQLPPFDLVAETMVPVMITDSQELPPFVLEPEPKPVLADVVGRAVQMRERALFESGGE